MKYSLKSALCCLVLGVAYGCGGGDDETIVDPIDEFVDPNSTTLTLQLAGSMPGVAPILKDNDGTINLASTFTATVSGFQNESDAAGANLKIGAVSGLETSVEGSVQGNTKTFVVTVQHDGESALSCKEETVHVELSAIPSGYSYAGGQSIQIALRTGETKDCRILINGDNILAFNRYANTSKGLQLHYELTEDIVLPKPSPGQSNWTAIGTSASSYEFVGSLDGKGHTISGLEINKSSANHQGFFGYIYGGSTKRGEIENLGLIDANVVGNNSVGALAGYFYYSGTVDILAVRNCYVKGNSKVRGVNYVGGMVGYTYKASMQNVYSEAHVDGSVNVGGVVGRNSAGVENCYSTGDVRGQDNIGGVAGQGGPLTTCYATGEVYSYGTSSSPNYTGGVVASAGGSENTQYCMALNPKVSTDNKGTYNRVGRIGFRNGGTTTNVYAFDGLLDGDGDTLSWTNRDLAQTLSGFSDGADISADELDKGNKIPDSFKTFPWTYAQGSLPGLFGQTVQMPGHLLPQE